MFMIKAKFAGQFYEADFQKLEKQIIKCFLHKKGPGALPVKRKNKELIGAILPHAGYDFSGAAAAWGYKEIAESKMPRCYIILAPDHNSRHDKITVSKENWETPFGVVSVDKEYVDELINKCNFVVEDKIEEHAIEVQLPFLQYVSRDKLKDLKIVPLIIPSNLKLEELAEVIEEIDENVCILASSDFTHYGLMFNYTPFVYSVKENLEKLDKASIKFILDLDSKGFIDFVNKEKATICGKYAISAAIKIVKKLYARKGKLLTYYTSGDLLDNYANSVSYATIIFD